MTDGPIGHAFQNRSKGFYPMTCSLTPEVFSHSIERIYDCAIDHSL